jgi:hypothetical protein
MDRAIVSDVTRLGEIAVPNALRHPKISVFCSWDIEKDVRYAKILIPWSLFANGVI